MLRSLLRTFWFPGEELCMQALLCQVEVGKLFESELSLMTRIGSLIASLRKPRLQRQRERRQTIAEQWLCTCAIIHGTFLCRPLENNNVK